MAEQELCARHLSRRKDADRYLPLLPAAKRLRHIGEDLPNELATPVAILPDPALQLLERRRRAVAIHEPAGVGADRREPRGFRFVGPGRYRLALQEIRSLLFAERGEQDLVRRRTRVPFEVGTQ